MMVGKPVVTLRQAPSFFNQQAAISNHDGFSITVMVFKKEALRFLKKHHGVLSKRDALYIDGLARPSESQNRSKIWPLVEPLEVHRITSLKVHLPGNSEALNCKSGEVWMCVSSQPAWFKESEVHLS